MGTVKGRCPKHHLNGDVEQLPQTTHPLGSKSCSILASSTIALFKRRCTVFVETFNTFAVSAWVSPCRRISPKTSFSSSGKLSIASRHPKSVHGDLRVAAGRVRHCPFRQLDESRLFI